MKTSSATDIEQCLRQFKEIPEKSILALESFRNDGGLVVGVYCIYAPSELIRAAGAVPVGLCGKRQAPIEIAERDLPASFCPLIKSSYGYAVSNTCPFFNLSDVLCAETTCDGKKKMYELMGQLKPMHVMQLPHTQLGAPAQKYWLESLRQLEQFLCTHGAKPTTPTALTEQIRLHNRMREKMRKVLHLAADSRSPLGGLDLLAIMESKGFIVNIEDYIGLLDNLELSLSDHLAQPGRTAHPGARILLTGVPVGKGSEKIIQIIEELGARVVCMENCTGSKGLELMVDELAEPMEDLASRYLQIPCSCMSPNPGRRESLKKLAHDFGVQGVVDLTWLGCHTYNAESRNVSHWIEKDVHLPTLHIETDYSTSDQEQLRTRIEAYLEVVS